VLVSHNNCSNRDPNKQTNKRLWDKHKKTTDATQPKISPFLSFPDQQSQTRAQHTQKTAQSKAKQPNKTHTKT